MTKTIVIGDPHALPSYNNDRADWIGEFIADEKPDEVIVIGDLADMPSLCSYDKGTRAFAGRSYAKDIESACEFNDRLWRPTRKRKKRLPKRVILEGNHEHRIERALDMSPELQGTVSFDDLQWDKDYDEIIRYDGQTPGIYESNGCYYAHYFASGAMGRAIGGEHMAYSLITKKFMSCTAGHDHRLDYCIRSKADGSKMMGLVVGTTMDYKCDWVGQAGEGWWSGVCVKDNIEDGVYDLRCVSMEALKKEYKD